ncbi:MAG: Gfo/Idh/MocA family oxidoreductase, partial [Armatimonadetes bacterium]|nr:Gfo/Idh/MocA family oxidoreductase [Armatimonadota bacterium]
MRKAKVALVGLGGWGATQSLPALGEAGNLDLVTWFDANPDTVAEFRNQMPVPPTGSFEEIVGNPSVEGVILIVPNHVHESLAVQAAGR